MHNSCTVMRYPNLSRFLRVGTRRGSARFATGETHTSAGRATTSRSTTRASGSGRRSSGSRSRSPFLYRWKQRGNYAWFECGLTLRFYVQLYSIVPSLCLCGCHKEQRGDYFDLFVHNFDVLIVIVFLITQLDDVYSVLCGLIISGVDTFRLIIFSLRQAICSLSL